MSFINDYLKKRLTEKRSGQLQIFVSFKLDICEKFNFQSKLKIEIVKFMCT